VTLPTSPAGRKENRSGGVWGHRGGEGEGGCPLSAILFSLHVWNRGPGGKKKGGKRGQSVASLEQARWVGREGDQRGIGLFFSSVSLSCFLPSKEREEGAEGDHFQINPDRGKGSVFPSFCIIRSFSEDMEEKGGGEEKECVVPHRRFVR